MNFFISKLTRFFNIIIALSIITICFYLVFNIMVEAETIIPISYEMRPYYALGIVLCTLILLTTICGIISILSQIQIYLEEINSKDNSKESNNLLY